MFAAALSLRSKALLMLLLANAFWGLSFPLIKAVVLVHERLIPTSSTWFITAMTVMPRLVLAVVVLALWQGRRLADITRGEWRQGIVLGLFAALGMLFQNDGLQFTDASTSAFLTQFYAILIPIYVAVRARRSPGVLIWVCSGLVLAGVAVLGRFDWAAMRLGRGEVETLIASVFFMGQILWLERPEFAANRAMKITIVMFATQAVIFVALALASAPYPKALVELAASPGWVVFVLGLTVFSTIGAYSLMNLWQPKITATEAGLVYCVEPIFGSVFALFLPAVFSVWAGIAYANEQPTQHLLVGGGLITLANVILQLRPPPGGPDPIHVPATEAATRESGRG